MEIAKFREGERLEFERPTIILASGSPRRARALKNINIEFKQITSSFDDSTVNFSYAHEGINKRQQKKYALEMALEKLRPFIGNVKNGAVITSDTTVFCRGRILEKPGTKEKCREQHEFISGQKAIVYNSVAVYYNGKILSKVPTLKEKILPLSSELIDEICEEPEVLDCAGYMQQGKIGPYIVSKNKFKVGDAVFAYTTKKILKKLNIL